MAGLSRVREKNPYTKLGCCCCYWCCCAFLRLRLVKHDLVGEGRCVEGEDLGVRGVCVVGLLFAQPQAGVKETGLGSLPGVQLGGVGTGNKPCVESDYLMQATVIPLAPRPVTPPSCSQWHSECPDLGPEGDKRHA